MRTLSWIPHWFDLLMIVGLAWGLRCGRRRGVSGELLFLLEWIAIFFICGLYYEQTGMRLANSLNISPNIGFVLVYILIGCVVKGVCGILHRAVGNKLVSKDFFGRWEYYLGILAGMARMACILFVVLALLCAKHVTQQDLYSMEAFQKENFGGVTFPTLGEMKYESLNRSVSGKLANYWFNRLLINAVDPSLYEIQSQQYQTPDWEKAGRTADDS
ncbi:MAG: Colicin production protein [Verrucomicrobiales bacterium]|nr:Colicin production protein [Verrucomicrobiales bacterium]